MICLNPENVEWQWTESPECSLFSSSIDQPPVQHLLHLTQRPVSDLNSNEQWWRTVVQSFISRYLCHLPFFSHSALDQMISAAPDELLFSKHDRSTCWEALTAVYNTLVHFIEQESAKLNRSPRKYLEHLDESWAWIGQPCFSIRETPSHENLTPPSLSLHFQWGFDRHPDGSPRWIPLARAFKFLNTFDEPKTSFKQLTQTLNRLVKKSPFFNQLFLRQHELHQFLEPIPLSLNDASLLLKDQHHLHSLNIQWDYPPSWKHLKKTPQIHTHWSLHPTLSDDHHPLIQFNYSIQLNGQDLNEDEMDQLHQNKGLLWIQNQWVLNTSKDFQTTLKRFLKYQQQSRDHGLTLSEALLFQQSQPTTNAHTWIHHHSDQMLQQVIHQLRQTPFHQSYESSLTTGLRPYQKEGVRWLFELYQLQLGGCLADDMGLGKTIQILAFLLTIPRKKDQPHLLVAPAFLMDNWQEEIQKFAPSLKTLLLRSYDHSNPDLMNRWINECDLLIVSYNNLSRWSFLTERSWHVVIADEAQALKNHKTLTTQHAKKIKAYLRLALTGTPVENQMTDLWSIFDFTNPGLLGSMTQFASFYEQCAHLNDLSPLRTMIQPYLLRRLKSDPLIVSDLPAKSEYVQHCSLTPDQAHLYQQTVNHLQQTLQKAEGIQRQGLVISYLTKLKQICNHPSHFLQESSWDKDASGKLQTLLTLAHTIADNQAKLIVFTQYQEAIQPLHDHLQQVFQKPGLVIHGKIPPKERQKIVHQFQTQSDHPFMVLTVKSGGTGLNLTAASYVIHYDRWWNPAVETQATDRAFRLGQTQPVQVYKLVCKGTIEDKIDQMIQSKMLLADEALTPGNPQIFNDLSDQAILQLLQLDLPSVISDSSDSDLLSSS